MKEERKLIGKLTEVMEQVQYIQKTGYNQMHNYRYAQEADVVEKCRSELAKRKVFLKQDTKEVAFNRTVKTKSGGELTVATLTIEFTFIDGETGERESFTVVGEGMDSGDKAVYKAMTGALKYALMKSFMIPTGDDPERDNDDESSPQQPQKPTGKSGGKKQSNTPKGKPANVKMSDEDAIKITSLVLAITGDDANKKNRLEMWLRNKVKGFQSLDEDMDKKTATMVIGYLEAYKEKQKEEAAQ